MIVLGLGVSRKETKKIHSFLNNQKDFDFNFESDIQKISWNNSENIIVNRIKKWPILLCVWVIFFEVFKCQKKLTIV